MCLKKINSEKLEKRNVEDNFFHVILNSFIRPDFLCVILYILSGLIENDELSKDNDGEKKWLRNNFFDKKNRKELEFKYLNDD